jgi:protein TonB
VAKNPTFARSKKILERCVMSVEEKRSAEQIGTLGSCLIEGDSEQKSRERKTKRRALTISIALQSLAIVALVVTPLLAKTEKLSFVIATPMPPYRPMPNRPISEARPQVGNIRQVCITCWDHIPSKPIAIATHPLDTTSTDAPNLGNEVPIPGVPGGNAFDGHKNPAAPEEPARNQTRRITKGGEVQQAMLTRRVEPVYPPLPRQLHRSGQVHLRAVISTEGNVESLQVIDGDPMFLQSALDAVKQWRYKPTQLNGQPVEVETIITVVYTLNQ